MTTKKKKEDKPQGLIDLVFSWSIADVMNQNLYRNKVDRIPETFSSADEYFKSFIYHLIEETRADLRSNLISIFHAPLCEISYVKKAKNFDPQKNLSYVLFLKKGSYEPENGDLIALTEVKPKCVDDLDRPKRPYVIASVQKMKDEDSVKITVLSSKEISYQKPDKKRGIEKNQLFAVYLTNMITNERIWASLHSDLRGENKIIGSVLRTNPLVEAECSICLTNASNKIEDLSSFGLDDSQRAAVFDCIALGNCHHKSSVKLIWGPPGTGKTKTVSALLCCLLGMKCRTLTCAPTNVAVLGVVKRLMSLLEGKLPYGSYGLGDIVLFGNGERLKIDDHEELYDIFLDKRVDVLARCFAPLTGWKGSLESMICLLEEPEKQYLMYLEKLRDANEKNKDTCADDAEAEDDNEIISKEESSGNENKIHKAKTRGKYWKEIIKHNLKDIKNKKLKNKKPCHKRRQSKSSEKNKIENNKSEASEDPIIPWTFREFVTRSFNRVGEQLIFCLTGLYTHMPTSLLTLEILKSKIKAYEMLQTVKTLLYINGASDKELKLALKGNETMDGVQNRTNLNGVRLEFIEVLKSLRVMSVPAFYEYDQIRSFCLKSTCLIFCTASSSAKLRTKGMDPIKLVVIDEAAQLKECESTIPLQLCGLNHAILVGDEKQLPAMVQSEICQKADFGRSLFERLVILGHKKHLLNIQYRMHPSISLFPNREFYAKKIKDGKNVLEKSYKQRFLNDKMFGAYSFINVTNGNEELDDRHSWRNMVEVAVVAEIISLLYKECMRTKRKVRIGCISAYKAQVAAIQGRLGEAYSTDASDKFSVNVRSVDGFQGGEEDLIIISTVRCNGNGSVGFLSNSQRVNVALTRARYCLWILGNASTLLNSGKVWKKLVMDAKSRQCFYNAHDNMNLSMAMSKAMIELRHIHSLFSMDSILFKTSKWKISFSNQFQESMKRLKQSGTNDDVVSLLVKISNGWRLTVKKDDALGNEESVCYQLLESYEVNERLRLIWNIDILQENSQYIQVIKIWDILSKNEIPKLVEKLDNVFGNYTVNHMSRCLFKRIEGDLTLPMTWPVSATSKSAYSRKEANHELASKLAAISLQPSQLTTNKDYWKCR